MKWRTLLIAAPTFAVFLSLGRPSFAQETPATPSPDAPIVSTTAAPSYPQVTCTSSDAAACEEILQIASDTRDQLSPILQLASTWRFPVHIHVLTPDDPLTAKINREAAAVFAQGTTMKIEAVLPINDPNAREFVQRQFVTALLWEKFFATTSTFDKHTPLDVVPLWLLEGLREWANQDPEHDRESIVRRAVQNQHASTLAEVTGWHELSDDRLLGLWQRAFCYYLVYSLIGEDPQREAFQQWLASYAGANPSSAQFLFPTESNWQRELIAATGRAHDIVYTWAESESELEAAETFTIAPDKKGKVETWSLDTLAKLPHNKIVIEALQQKILVLTALELRVHPSWRPIVELYRFGLNAVINDPDQVDAKSILVEAHQRRLNEIAYHEKLLDYVNWFEVTKDYAGNTTHFNSYFSTAQEMERVQADPVHPNPIRANLLQIESQL